MTTRLPENMIVAGEYVPVTVIGLSSNGIIVQLDGTQYTSFIHISKIAKGYVNAVTDYVAVGDKFDAMGSRKGPKPELVLYHLNLQPKNKEEHKADVPEQYTPEQHTPKSLDDMIAEATRAYRDKFSSKDKDVKPRRRHYYKKSYD